MISLDIYYTYIRFGAACVDTLGKIGTWMGQGYSYELKVALLFSGVWVMSDGLGSHFLCNCTYDGCCEASPF